MKPSTSHLAKKRSTELRALNRSSSSAVSGAAVIVIVARPCSSPPAHWAHRGHDLGLGFGDQDCLLNSDRADTRLADVAFHRQRHPGFEDGVVVRRERRWLP